MPNIRNIAVGLPVRDGHVLLSESVDRVRDLRFHRAVGGGIEFGETAVAALRREFREELDVDLERVQLLGVVENLFSFEGAAGHEYAHVFAVESAALDAVPLDAELVVLDEGSPVRWVPLDTDTPVFPEGVLDLLARRRPRRRPDVTGVEVIGGQPPLTLTLHEHDERWAAAYREHRRRIVAALGSTPADVHHIGSTAVPGLAAKPIVDIVVAVDDITAEEDHVDLLVAAGYHLRVREPGHRLVRTPARDVHVHVYERGDPAVEDYLLLRDHLRVDAADRALYEDTKRALISRRWSSMDGYADAKTEVIEAIKARARAARRR